MTDIQLLNSLCSDTKDRPFITKNERELLQLAATADSSDEARQESRAAQHELYLRIWKRKRKRIVRYCRFEALDVLHSIYVDVIENCRSWLSKEDETTAKTERHIWKVTNKMVQRSYRKQVKEIFMEFFDHFSKDEDSIGHELDGERRAALAEEIQKLHEKTQECVRLTLCEGLKRSEIATKLRSVQAR